MDLNQNTPYNYKIDMIKSSIKAYSFFRYNNIEDNYNGLFKILPKIPEMYKIRKEYIKKKALEKIEFER